MLLVHGQGRTVNVEQIKTSSSPRDGVPIRVSGVADVQINHEIGWGP
jgi:Cu/Ag efflux pump CusA